MKRTNIKITRFEIGEFYVDIVETKGEIEAWLCGKKYGTSNFMFGMQKSSTYFHDFYEIYNGEYFNAFCKLVENNLDEYIEMYEACIV